MKPAIKLTALFLLASASLFAAASAKPVVPATADDITFSSMPKELGIDVKVEKNTPGKAIVLISDQDGNIIRKDILSSNKGLEKAYVLSELANGDYTIAVTSQKQVVKKSIHVYDEGDTKMYFINQ